MKARIVIILLAVVFLASGVGYAAIDSLDLPWWTVDGGGAVPALSGGGLTLQGTAGQPDSGFLSGGRFTLVGGFWNPTSAEAIKRVYLPILAR